MGCLPLNCLWGNPPWTLLISEACLLGSVLVGLGQNRAGDYCSNLSVWGIEFQGLGMLPGADLLKFLVGKMYVSKVSSWHTNGGKTTSTPRLHRCGLFSHFTGDLWMNQTVKLFRESRNNLAESYQQLIVSSMANANCFEQWQQTSLVNQLSLKADFSWTLASGSHAALPALFAVALNLGLPFELGQSICSPPVKQGKWILIFFSF